MTQHQTALPPPSENIDDQIVRLRYLAQWFWAEADEIEKTNQVSLVARLLLGRDHEEELAPNEAVEDLISRARSFEDQANYMLEHGKRPALMVYLANEREYDALADAEWNGNAEPLAEIILDSGQLKTQAAREWVAARVRGEKMKRGQKRTTGQMTKELIILGEIRSIQEERECTEYEACVIYSEQCAIEAEEPPQNYLTQACIRSIQEERGCTEAKAREIYSDQGDDRLDTVRTDVRRAKRTIEESTGRKPHPPLQAPTS